MAVQHVTVRLPDKLYDQVKRRAQHMHRSVEEEVAAVMAEALPAQDDLPAGIGDEMAQLAFLTDDELWRAARSRVTARETERMQTLMWKRQREGLTQREQSEAERLVQRSDRVMLVRAQSAALLKARGHDISELIANP